MTAKPYMMTKDIAKRASWKTPDAMRRDLLTHSDFFYKTALALLFILSST